MRSLRSCGVRSIFAPAKNVLLGISGEVVLVNCCPFSSFSPRHSVPVDPLLAMHGRAADTVMAIVAKNIVIALLIVMKSLLFRFIREDSSNLFKYQPFLLIRIAFFCSFAKYSGTSPELFFDNFYGRI